MRHNLWAVTSYFNPLRWHTRKQNYNHFRSHLGGVPLLTVEWSLQGSFELIAEDADILVQVQGGNLLWQKERLLNIGFQRLPDCCEFVAWLDCDILFAEPSWADSTCHALDRLEVIQPFSQVIHRGPNTTDKNDLVSILRQEQGIIAAAEASPSASSFYDQLLITTENELLNSYPNTRRLAPGFAWAARRDWLKKIGGLYDRRIIGGGDTLFAFATAGRLNELLEIYTKANILTRSVSLDHWLRRVLDNQPRLGHIKGELTHLFHGFLTDRRYMPRHQDLAQTGFNPDQHLLAEPDQPWRLADDAPIDILRVIERYFTLRKEDDGR